MTFYPDFFSYLHVSRGSAQHGQSKQDSGSVLSTNMRLTQLSVMLGGILLSLDVQCM